MELIKRAKQAYIIVSAVMMILGVVLIVYPEISALTLCYIIGSLMAIFGIARLVGYFSRDLFRLAFQFDLALGIFSLLAGLLIILHPVNIITAMPVIIGVFVTIDGVFKVQTAYDARLFGMKRWWSVLVLALLTCAAGIFLIIDPFEGAKAVMILLGVTLLIDGIQNLCVVLYTVKTKHDVRGPANVVYVIDSDEER